MSMKNPLTPAGIEPATYRFVAQHLNHCATPSYDLRLCLFLCSLEVAYLINFLFKFQRN